MNKSLTILTSFCASVHLSKRWKHGDRKVHSALKNFYITYVDQIWNDLNLSTRSLTARRHSRWTTGLKTMRINMQESRMKTLCTFIISFRGPKPVKASKSWLLKIRETSTGQPINFLSMPAMHFLSPRFGCTPSHWLPYYSLARLISGSQGAFV